MSDDRGQLEEVTGRIVDLAAALVRVPSRGGEDPVEPIVHVLSAWLAGRGLEPRRLVEGGREVGVYLHLRSGSPGPALCLDACLDTAPFGDERSWKHAPTSGKVEGGRLYGRGSADSKIAVALFANLAAELARARALAGGELYVLFDADEHTGGFGGVKAFLKAVPRRPDAVVIGYPGNYGVVVGARGFLRAKVTTGGVAAHSGSRSQGPNAIVKMARLVALLETKPLPAEPDPEFAFGPRVSVTEVRGGEGFSQIPDRCSCNVDFRLTPHVDRGAAAEWIREAVGRVDRSYPSPTPTAIELLESWPAYRLEPTHPIARVLAGAAREVFGREVPQVVCGPSNIGNYLAALGIPALCGFGVGYKNTHALNEYVELESIAPVYETYWNTVLRYLPAHDERRQGPR